MRWAVLEGINVINVIEADKAFIAEHELNAICVDDKSCGIGFTYVNGEFVAPPAQVEIIEPLS